LEKVGFILKDTIELYGSQNDLYEFNLATI